jgi:hypothetical protein
MGLFDSGDPQEYLNQALKTYQDINVPTIASEQVNNLPLETIQGVVNPDAIAVAQQNPSAYNNIALDPAARAAQMAALSQYTNIANAGGLDPAAKLALQQAIDAANAQSQGAQGAIMRSAQAEGQGGGDFALTQRAIASQGASNAGSEQGLQAAAMAEANRQAALNQMSNIGGNVNASDYAQAAQKAAAQNQINATNQAATNAANTSNVANRIQTGEYNLGNAQNVNAANAATGQKQAYYNAALPQQRFNNEITKAGGMTGVNETAAQQQQLENQGSLQFAGTAIGAGGKMMAGAAHGGMISDEMKKGYTCYADGGVAHDHAICMKLGGHVGGHAKVEGDSETNDTVPAMLSPGELVIPRSVPKDGKSMEEFARNAPVPGTGKRVDLTNFTKNYKRGGR